jgi:hypothetical protein
MNRLHLASNSTATTWPTVMEMKPVRAMLPLPSDRDGRQVGSEIQSAGRACDPLTIETVLPFLLWLGSGALFFKRK